MNTEKVVAFQDRLMTFSVDIIQLTRHLKDYPRPLVNQIIRSATSIGANYAEAQNAISRADFRNKLYIAKKEAAETLYWLKLMQRLAPNLEISAIVQESLELVMILQKSTISLENKAAATK